MRDKRRADRHMTNIIKPVSYSQTWTFFEGKWHEGNAPIMGPRTHAAWLGSTVFDGARAFEGVSARSRSPLRAGELVRDQFPA